MLRESPVRAFNDGSLRITRHPDTSLDLGYEQCPMAGIQESRDGKKNFSIPEWLSHFHVPL